MQLVLGAGAIQASAKLRSITAKHLGEQSHIVHAYTDTFLLLVLSLDHTPSLTTPTRPSCPSFAALTSQSLGLVAVLLPHVRAALATRLQAKQQAFLVELDRVKQARLSARLDQRALVLWSATLTHLSEPRPNGSTRQEYQEHHEKLLGKLVAMIGDLIAHSASHSGLRERDWDDMAAGPCRFVEDVIKGVSTMHRVLFQLLPPAQVQVRGLIFFGRSPIPSRPTPLTRLNIINMTQHLPHHIQDVFARIFDLLAHRVTEYLEDAPPPQTTAGRQRRVDEISHLATSLSLLRGVRSEALAQLEARFKRLQQEQDLEQQQQGEKKDATGKGQAATQAPLPATAAAVAPTLSPSSPAVPASSPSSS